MVRQPTTRQRDDARSSTDETSEPVFPVHLGRAARGPCPPTTALVAGDVLEPGQRIEARSRAYSAVMGADGDFAVRRAGASRPVWSSGTAGHQGASVVMHDDGDLTVRAPDGRCLWRSATDGHPGAFLDLDDDGQLVLRDFYRTPLWHSERVPGDR